MVISGELDFFTLMGGILGQAVPVAEVQQVPFAFKMEGDAHAAADGALGADLREEMAAKGLYGFPVMAFDNGMRQTSTTNRPIVNPADFAGIRIRLPAGQMQCDRSSAKRNSAGRNSAWGSSGLASLCRSACAKRTSRLRNIVSAT